MRPLAKKYNTNYKKKIDIDRDTFLPRRAPSGVVRCAGCGAFYHRRRWTLTPPADVTPPLGRRPTYCPACRKIKEHSASGELQLRGVSQAERGEAVRILRNEEERARDKNPLERIMLLNAGAGIWRVATTTEKLAQRLGRALRKARGGKLTYKWSHNNKFVRVIWEKST
jgi:NMD protein affecting ribosome stability and mRNA decay